MAVVTTVTDVIPLGEGWERYIGTVVPGTYATNGVVVDIANVNERIYAMNCSGSGYVGEFVASAQKLKLYRQKDPAAAGGADIALVEVANGVDLSGVTLPMTADGK